MANNENLKPWPKGVSGNPGGRPKSKPVTEAYQARVSEELPDPLRKVRVGRAWIELPKGSTFLDLISFGQCLEAAKGNTAAAKEIADRVEGKARQSLDVQGDLNVASILETIARRRAERLPGDR